MCDHVDCSQIEETVRNPTVFRIENVSRRFTLLLNRPKPLLRIKVIGQNFHYEIGQNFSKFHYESGKTLSAKTFSNFHYESSSANFCDHVIGVSHGKQDRHDASRLGPDLVLF